MSRRGVWTEMLAFFVLESLGFNVEELRYRVQREGVEVAEVDALARRNGELYAVEVKSGKVSTTDVRQALANAQLIGAKPLIVARGFADKSAEVYARELGVEVILLPELLHFVSLEELLDIVEEAVLSSLERLLDFNVEELSAEELRALHAIAVSRDLAEACRRLELDNEECSRLLGNLRSKGVISEVGRFSRLRMQARLLLVMRRALSGEQSLT